MQDRIPLYPGRVKMTPVAGQANTYDMVRADDPTQAGTPLNKATLLKDATAALFGLGTGAVPDDILSLLSKGVLFQNDTITDVLGNLILIPVGQIKNGVRIKTGSYTGTGSSGSSGKNTLTFDFIPDVVIITTNTTSTFYPGVVFINGQTESDGIGSNDHGGNYGIAVEWTGKTVRWYAGSELKQLNGSGNLYHYIAIGR